MHFLLFSGVMIDEDFQALSQRPSPPNPSNQNFYHTLVRILSKLGPVDIIVNRPIAPNNATKRHYEAVQKTMGNVTYHYLPFYALNKIKGFSIAYHSLKALKALVKADTLMVVDTLNAPLVILSKRLAKATKRPRLGIVTDHPHNLSHGSSHYQKRILEHFKQFDYYLCLNTSLNEVANPHKRPSLILEGLISHDFAEPLDTMLHHKPYFFFGGAIYERYGIRQLISAFQQVNADIDLVIAGHGNDIPYIEEAMTKDPRLRFVGLLSMKEMHAYERQALLNINPRTFDEQLDRFSVPSKVIEYVASGVPCLSTKHRKLQEIFGDDVWWAKDGTIDDLYQAMMTFLSTPEKTRKEKALSAQKKAFNRYLEASVAKLLSDFCNANISCSSCRDKTES